MGTTGCFPVVKRSSYEAGWLTVFSAKLYLDSPMPSWRLQGQSYLMGFGKMDSTCEVKGPQIVLFACYDTCETL